MQVVIDQPAANDRRHFVYAIPEKKAAIEQADMSLILLHELTCAIYNPAQFPTPVLQLFGWRRLWSAMAGLANSV
ncbi:hypothetical protein AGR2A_pb10166 [Agrobacterium genomosp. 2 str. CFBP 5494]|uniref:Uncharacterized protein n=1 Tax=Agrobacterium genomosp. 2 str. CFBP 5494 TaxID=1183436 RepID=A0A9W5B7Q0_9HYPH|nr:hypothetical protein AGR2A_pb10166 [Agrobacterium genomosp. 2 str. CFBP 5494]